MRSRRPGRGFVVTLTAVLLVSGLIGPTRVVATGGTAGGPYDAGATELERILNIERVQAGLAALPIDTFLAAKARDGAVACLADPSLVMEGRAKDLAVNGWVGASPHNLRLCPTESITDALNAWGYTGWRGEIIAWNAGTNYADPGWYPSDCGVPGYPACEFLTYFTVSVAATGFMEEPGHRAIVLGAFDRFACGSWIAPDVSPEPGAYWYDCMFAEGGPNPTVPPPTTAPSFPPQAPTGVEAVATNHGDALITWAASDGALASPISAYTVTSSPDGKTCATAGALSCTVMGLTPGTPYTFTVRATNGDGTGPPSDASNTVLVPVTAGTVSRLDAATQYPDYPDDRYATAAAVSAATFDPGVPVVYIASGLNFPDALAGAAAGGHLGGPVLLVNGTIPAVTAAELTRLQPVRIVVLGGTRSVSEAILAALGGYL